MKIFNKVNFNVFKKTNIKTFNLTQRKFIVSDVIPPRPKFPDLSRRALIRNMKLAQDTLKVVDLTDFKTFAAMIQSDMYHEYLFESLTSANKATRDMRNKFKDIAGKSGIKPEELSNKYNQNFEKLVAENLTKAKEFVAEQAKTDPKILQSDPIWVEKIKTPEGFLEYINKFLGEEDSPDNWWKYPELNEMLMSVETHEITEEYIDLYLKGFLDEDQMRVVPHVDAMKEYYKEYEEELEGAYTINNEMWVDKLKSDTLKYIETVLDPTWQKYSTSYARTSDNKRIDVGIMFQRDPIFLDTHPEDMEFGKYRRKFFKKYYANSDKYIEEINQFNDTNVEYWEVASGQVKINPDNKPNVRKWNPEKNEYDFYSATSKHWTCVDPDVKDIKSIQYASLNRTYMLFKNRFSNQLEFPTIPLYNGDSFNEVKYKLYFLLTSEKFKIYFPSPYPSYHITREFYEHEKNDPKNRGLTGVRVYFYDAYHYRGEPTVTPNMRHPYVDYIFTPKHELNKYVPENYWHAVVTALNEK